MLLRIVMIVLKDKVIGRTGDHKGNAEKKDVLLIGW
jgi:hypothetical protein